MKKYFLFLAVFCALVRISAQTNSPIKLALISETDEVLPAADLLTAKLSGNDQIQLLERDQIEKVYREQRLSAANTDYLKLGHVLGADGLLLLNVVRTPQTTNLMARLIAVKPGVILSDAGFSWPLKNTAQWSDSAAAYLNAFLPKLTVLPKDAIPISVVNLRSAINSTDAVETERQLKLLVIQRLSQERQLFVLERQKMQLLGDEKSLAADDSAFWDGSYLLEGVVDQNGYSPDTVTINARLTPPKGGAPILFAVSGSRTNLTEVINQLAVKVNAALKIQGTAPAWKATDEAAQFFKEAQWAMRWGAYTEAQSAADSAWALGKNDLDCALVRVKAYLAALTAATGEFQNGEDTLSPGSYDADNHPLGPVPSAARVQKEITALLKDCPFGLVYRVREANSAKIIDYGFALQPPDPANIDRALHTLEIYYEYSRTSPDGQAKILWRGIGWNDWHNSEWYDLGLKNLVAASKVLLSFNLVPAAQPPVADKLAELRARARSIAKLISDSPTVHDSYFVGDRIVTHDELGNTVEESPNIFRCEVKWGYLWQETPEEEIELYRDLLDSPVFSYIHRDFWRRELQTPRLAGWNENDRQRIPQVWDHFFSELENSTNTLWRLESRALTLADADNEQKTGDAFTNLFEAFFENRATLIANPVEILYLEWGTGDLVEQMGGDSGSKNKDLLEHIYSSRYRPEIEAMDREYWDKTIPARKTAQAFEEQKRYLADFTPYDFQKFMKVFSLNDYTKAQAAELKPLITAYKSNLLAHAASSSEKFVTGSNVQWIELTLERTVDQILNPPAPQSPVPAKKTVAGTVRVAKAVSPTVTVTGVAEIITNAIAVNRFLPIPLDGLPGDWTNKYLSPARITAHHWFEGKLLLDFEYNAFIYSFDEQGNWKGTRNAMLPAIALLDPVTGHWQVISRPEVDEPNGMVKNPFYHRSVLYRGELFNCDGGKIQKYDSQNQQWVTLAVSDGNNYELFVVNGRLYGANGNTIFEIINNGKATQLMASNRRQPAVLVLDTEDLGTPTLFAGPDGDLRVSTRNKIFTWTNNDWCEICAAPPASFPPAIFPDAVLFQSDGWNVQPARVSLFSEKSNRVELCLGKTSQRTAYAHTAATDVSPVPLWKLPLELSLPNLSASFWQSGLYLMADHSKISDIIDEQQHNIIGKKILPENGYDTVLFCFSPDLPVPQKVFLKFDTSAGYPPAAGMDLDSLRTIPGAGPAPWMLFTTNYLICGRELPGTLMGGSELPGYKAGVWLLPLSQIEPAIAAQKQSQLAQQAQAAAAVEQTAKNQLIKYDLNHNGVIDPDEKEAALDDPAFIAWQLDLIDTNHNYRIDLEDLAYFDANRNKILEPKEQAGIEIAQHLLAEKCLKKFDADGDDLLNKSEFQDFLLAGDLKNDNNLGPAFFDGHSHSYIKCDQIFQRADDNHDGLIDLSELESYLKQSLRRKIRLRGAAGVAFVQAQMQSGHAAAQKQLFKAEVEAYWQNPDSYTNQPAFNQRLRRGMDHFPHPGPNGINQ